MLDQIFKSILLTSAIGTFFAAALLLIKPVTNKRFSCGWHYYMWLAVLFVMICPLRLAKIKLPYERITEHKQSAQYTQTAELQETPANDTSENNKAFIAEKELSVLKTIPSKIIFMSIIKQINFSAIWLGMAFLLLFGRIIGYTVFIKAINKNSQSVICPTLEQYTKRKISVRKSSRINSPLVTGVFKPILILPDTELSNEELNNILLHETTHLKRQDILYKWFAELVKCIHWFNPMIHLICKKINTDCEISCDNTVVQNMNTAEKQRYIDTILSLLTAKKDKYFPLTTGMSGNMKNLRRRFDMIKNTANTPKTIRLLSVILSAVLLCLSLIISGSAATELLGDKYKSGQGAFITSDNIFTSVSGESYRNDEMNFVLDIPLSWNGKYAAERNGDTVAFYHKAIKDKYGIGILFYITAEDGIKTNRDFEESPVYHRIIATTIDKTYTLILPSDVQAPVWIDSDNEDVKLAEEYYKMSEDINVIADSINTTVTTLHNDNIILPKETVTAFFDAFNIGNYSYMHNFCTKSCIEKYFSKNNVFGIERALLVQLDIDRLEYAKSSNDFNICAEYRKNSNSVQTEKLYIQLMRQPSGVYLINDLSTKAFQ